MKSFSPVSSTWLVDFETNTTRKRTKISVTELNKGGQNLHNTQYSPIIICIDSKTFSDSKIALIYQYNITFTSYKENAMATHVSKIH